MRDRFLASFASLASVALLLVSCGSSGRSPGAAPTSQPRAVTTASAPASTTARRASPRTTTTGHRPATTTTRIPAATTTEAPPPTSAPAPETAPPNTTPVSGPSQMIVVDASSYGRSDATLSAYDRTASGWVRRFGPWTARIGRNGFAPPGAKREGDGRAPSGTYGFSFFFGIDANPGVSFPYRRITTAAIVWDDDPASANYNEWVDTRAESAGTHPEPMYDAPFYDYGAVIAYNANRTPGSGSAIFLHVSDGSSTAGCVALPVGALLQVLRWLTPIRSPLIRMGVDAPAPT